MAGTTYGLDALTAATTLDNLASRRVLERNDFVEIEPITLADRPGVSYRCAHLGH
jgi:ribosomal-protein-alanine N-acetyltransferase